MRLRPADMVYFIVLLLTACGTIEKSSMHGFSSGLYTQKLHSVKSKVYVVVTADSVSTYKLISRKPVLADTTSRVTYLITSNDTTRPPKFVKTSLDLDISTVLLKYRFKQQDFPNQLSSNLNLNLYSGFRKDYYSFSMQRSPTYTLERKMKHFEFDLGLFAGIGITPVNSYVTNDATSLEYDGIIFQKGIAAFIGMQRITAGISIGFDNLLDEHHQHWIYQQKPWLGFMIGINLGD